MKIIFFSLLLTLFTFSVSGEEFSNVVMKGDAYDKDNKLVYIETHTFKKYPGGEISEIQTKYHNPEGKLIAEIESNFSKDPFIPDTVFIDHRFKEKQELIYDKVSNLVTMKITDAKGKIKTNTIKRTENMVSGQGFHNYIISHFDDKKAEIKFIVLPKLDFFFNYKRTIRSGRSKKIYFKNIQLVLKGISKRNCS
jgi:hypothetical protein